MLFNQTDIYFPFEQYSKYANWIDAQQLICLGLPELNYSVSMFYLISNMNIVSHILSKAR